MPKTITDSYEVYQFDEHPDKEKILEKNRNDEVDNDWWGDNTLDHWTEKLNCIGFEDAKIWFSGFWSQGDGACFDATVNIDKLMTYLMYRSDRYSDGVVLHAIALADQNGHIEANIYTSNYHYNHQLCRRVDFTVNLDDSSFTSKMQDVELELEDLREALSRKIYRDLDKRYTYLTSDKHLTEVFKDQEFWFKEDGSIHYE